MGLFDYVRCEYQLPDDGPQDAEYQTKDTDAMHLEWYRVTREGRLIHESVRCEVVPPSEREYPDPNDARHFWGSVCRVPTGDVDTNYHGALCFYTDKDGEWFEYVCLFKDGSLIDIRRVRQ